MMQADQIKDMSKGVQQSFVAFWDDARLNSVVASLIEHYFPLAVRTVQPFQKLTCAQSPFRLCTLFAR